MRKIFSWRELALTFLILGVLMACAPALGPSVSSEAQGVLYLGIMVHLEGWDDQTSRVRFDRHVQLMREYADLFEAYGAKLTWESKEVTEGVLKWGDNVLLEMEQRGHGIGVHADVGGERNYDCSCFAADLRAKKKQLESLGVTVRHVSGICSHCDWVTAAADAGYLFTTGQVAYCCMSLPLEKRPPEFRNCPNPAACHQPFPTDLKDRIHPWRMHSGADWLTYDPNGKLVLLPASGGLTCMQEEATSSASGPNCEFTQEDIDAFIRQLEEALSYAEPDKVNIYYVSWSLGPPLDKRLLEAWLQRIQPYVQSGRVQWKTLPEMYDAYVAWEKTQSASSSAQPGVRGISWGEEVRLTHDRAQSLATQRGNALAVSGNTLHLVWVSSETRGDSEVYYMRSPDLGNSWTEPLRLTNAPGEARYVVVAAQGPKVYIAWSDNRDGKFDLYFKVSADSGATWSEDMKLTETDEHEAAIVSLVASENMVYVAWEEKWGEKRTRYGSHPFVLMYKYSPDGGKTWSDSIQVEKDITFESGSPSVVKGERDIQIIYGSNEVAVNNWELYSIRSADGGLTWSNKIRLTEDQNGDSRFPVAVNSGPTVHIVWWDDRDDPTKDRRGYPPLEPMGNYEIYYKRSADGGATWDADHRLTFNSAILRDPTLAVSGQNVYVVWSDNRDGNDEIYFKQSNDGGVTWGEDVRLTNAPGRSCYPSVAVDGLGNVHVIWMDNRDGNNEIYYRRRTRAPLRFRM